MADQTERAYQKQQGLFAGSVRVLHSATAKAKKVGKQGKRYYKNVGLGYKTPQDAITGTYVDKKCPFTGNVSIRGRILKGVVKTNKMKNTIIVRRDYLHYVRKYNRFEKRHKNVPAHLSPAFRVNEGDNVHIGQCRPLSKTVRFNVLRVDTVGSGRAKMLFKIIPLNALATAFTRYDGDTLDGDTSAGWDIVDSFHAPLADPSYSTAMHIDTAYGGGGGTGFPNYFSGGATAIADGTSPSSYGTVPPYSDGYGTPY